ncbi:hypothetical protein M3Y94_00907300 [Aphelenchoides besseyi]|nr:hypothetical protein M3Y94_00907300 [Aphelenchoides besseyi]
MFDVRIPSLSFLFGCRSVEAAECRHLPRDVSLISWPLGRLSARRSYLSDAILLNKPIGVKAVLDCNVLKRMDGKIKHYDFGFNIYIVDLTRYSSIGMQVKAWLQSSEGLKFELQDEWTPRVLLNDEKFIINLQKEFPATMKKLEDVTLFIKLRPFTSLLNELKPICNNPVHDKFSHCLGQTFDSNEYTDIVVGVNGELFMVAKILLCSHSSVFKAMFEHEYIEKTTGVVEIKDTESDVVRKMLRYFYTGKVEDIDESPDKLLALAHRFQVHELAELCANSLGQNLSLTNILNRLELVEIYGELIDFKHRVFTFAVGKFAQMRALPEWSDFCDRHPHVLVELLLSIQTETKEADTTISK